MNFQDEIEYLFLIQKDALNSKIVNLLIVTVIFIIVMKLNKNVL